MRLSTRTRSPYITTDGCKQTRRSWAKQFITRAVSCQRVIRSGGEGLYTRSVLHVILNNDHNTLYDCRAASSSQEVLFVSCSPLRAGFSPFGPSAKCVLFSGGVLSHFFLSFLSLRYVSAFQDNCTTRPPLSPRCNLHNNKKKKPRYKTRGFSRKVFYFILL